MADATNLEPQDAAAAEDDRSDLESLSGKASHSSLDSLELERLELAHDLWLLTWRGVLCISPKRGSAKRVLDLGTGTGVWAMDFADEQIGTTVIGVDLSPT
ncbi:Secondary metabolism regulator LAE1 [Colletotrichum orbiculare MAFF 240422]|uniref:Secondary metabolism regulator LAE1 n=1 Tax=Colletotrichum orbiculare (strain 104-T / ATCC 96160 / CBS 514.97 / LARS 414 / MAFF 240422) TaxID=1213857 RepID=A0A484FVE2_COLOR|nr:Secondary metabolism regulator LAE1 [Colletotrichum orbiculare MAFF 240422]